jgi:hypothetical protein
MAEAALVGVPPESVVLAAWGNENAPLPGLLIVICDPSWLNTVASVVTNSSTVVVTVGLVQVAVNEKLPVLAAGGLPESGLIVTEISAGFGPGVLGPRVKSAVPGEPLSTAICSGDDPVNDSWKPDGSPGIGAAPMT